MMGALLGRDLAVDLGTATTRLSVRGRAALVEEPSVTGETPALAGGVVVNAEAAAAVVRALLGRARWLGPWRPRMLACAPTDVTLDERGAVMESMRRAGATAIAVAPEPLAAAVGAGRDVSSPFAELVVDVGHGVTDCAVIRSGQVLVAHAVRIACSDLHAAVDELAGERYGVSLLPGEAARIVERLGVACRSGPIGIEATAWRKGEDRARPVVLAVRDVDLALEPVLGRILSALGELLRDLPPRVGVEVIESGILLTGGGALLPGMTTRVESMTGIVVRRAPDPLRAVIRGARAILPTVAAAGLWER